MRLAQPVFQPLKFAHQVDPIGVGHASGAAPLNALQENVPPNVLGLNAAEWTGLRGHRMPWRNAF